MLVVAIFNVPDLLISRVFCDAIGFLYFALELLPFALNNIPVQVKHSHCRETWLAFLPGGHSVPLKSVSVVFLSQRCAGFIRLPDVNAWVVA